MANAWGDSWGTSWGVSWEIGVNPVVTRDTHDGAHKIHLPIYERSNKKRPLSNIQIIYDKARELPRKQTKELRDAISEFVEPEVAQKAALPEIVKVNYEAIQANEQAYKKFTQALDNIQNNLVLIDKIQKEDEELLLLAVISCVIN